MLDGILNGVLSEEKFSTTGVTQGNLELPLPLNFLDSHQTKNSEMKSCTDPMFSLPLRRANPLGR